MLFSSAIRSCSLMLGLLAMTHLAAFAFHPGSYHLFTIQSADEVAVLGNRLPVAAEVLEASLPENSAQESSIPERSEFEIEFTAFGRDFDSSFDTEVIEFGGFDEETVGNEEAFGLTNDPANRSGSIFN